VKTKLLPKCVNPEPVSTVRQIDVQAPIIYGETQECVAKLSQSHKVKTDRYKHVGVIKWYACCKVVHSTSQFRNAYLP
jgi:hypothetical protein